MATTRISLGLSIAGLAAVLASFLWPHVDRGHSAWSEEKATQLQRAQSTLHKLGGHEHPGPQRQPATVSHEEREYQEALAAHESLRAELELAQNRGQRISRWLLWGGVALIAAGWLMARIPAVGARA
jgi:hypothetical protein